MVKGPGCLAVSPLVPEPVTGPRGVGPPGSTPERSHCPSPPLQITARTRRLCLGHVTAPRVSDRALPLSSTPRSQLCEPQDLAATQRAHQPLYGGPGWESKGRDSLCRISENITRLATRTHTYTKKALPRGLMWDQHHRIIKVLVRNADAQFPLSSSESESGF